MTIKPFAFVYYLAAFALAAVVIANANAASEDYGALYHHFTPTDQAEYRVKSFLEALSFGLYRGSTEKSVEFDETVASAKRHERYAANAAWGLLTLSVVFLALALLLSRSGRMVITEEVITHMLGVSIVFLIVGLVAPILTLVAYTDVTLLGRVVLKYESRGILTTVLELIESRNVFIAVVLFLFSVVTPALKLALSFLALKAQSPETRGRNLSVIGSIGKWSMADVLLVAILLAFFVTGSNGFTDSWLGPGLYFFAGYCVLSLLASHALGHIHTRSTP